VNIVQALGQIGMQTEQPTINGECKGIIEKREIFDEMMPHLVPEI
jgi:hypothetical protein